MTNTMSCGCEIISDNLGAYKIEYCPKHKAAPLLYEALGIALGALMLLDIKDKSWGAETLAPIFKALKAGERCIQ